MEASVMTLKDVKNFGEVVEIGGSGIDGLPSRRVMRYTAGRWVGLDSAIAPGIEWLPDYCECKLVEHKFSLQEVVTHFHSYMGTDPEIFLERKGVHVPAFWAKLPKKGPDVSMFWDGFQAEVRPTRALCLQQLGADISRLLSDLAASTGLELSRLPVAEVPADIMKSCTTEEVELGCMGSMNAYGMGGDIPGNPRELPYRFAGGHIHFGLKGLFEKLPLPEDKVLKAIKALDLLCGVPTVGMFERLDNPIRRRFYGLAGEFRLPAHGLEWRTLSNVWLQHPQIYHMVFMLARMALTLGLLNIRDEFKVSEDEVVYCINAGDVRRAREIVERNKNLYKAFVFNAVGGVPKKAGATWVSIMAGVDKVVELKGTIQDSWALTRSSDNNAYPLELTQLAKSYDWDSVTQ